MVLEDRTLGDVVAEVGDGFGEGVVVVAHR